MKMINPLKSIAKVLYFPSSKKCGCFRTLSGFCVKMNDSKGKFFKKLFWNCCCQTTFDDDIMYWNLVLTKSGGAKYTHHFKISEMCPWKDRKTFFFSFFWSLKWAKSGGSERGRVLFFMRIGHASDLAKRLPNVCQNYIMHQPKITGAQSCKVVNI